MSTQDLAELNKFANAPMSGSSKRAGRVLVRKEVKQRKESSNKDAEANTFQIPYHRQRDCRLGNCGRHVGPDIWKDVEWSKFSDTSDEEMVDVDAKFDGEEEMTAMEGYMRMAIDAEQGRTSADDKETTKGMQVGTAEVSRRVSPAKLCMSASSRRAEAAVGPLNETM